jgi:hypothetical protein
MEDVDDGQAEPLPYNPNNPAEVRAFYEKRRKRQLFTMLAVVWIFGIGALAIYYFRGFFNRSSFPFITIFAMALIVIVTGYVIWGLRRVYNGTYVPGSLGWGRKSAPPPAVYQQPYQGGGGAYQPYQHAQAVPHRVGEGEYDGPTVQPQVVVVQIGPDGRPLGPVQPMMVSQGARPPSMPMIQSPSHKNVGMPPPAEIGGGKYPAPVPVHSQGSRQIIL